MNYCRGFILSSTYPTFETRDLSQIFLAYRRYTPRATSTSFLRERYPLRCSKPLLKTKGNLKWTLRIGNRR